MDRTFLPAGTPTLTRMHTLALKRIFDRPAFTSYEEMELDIGIGAWVHHPDLSPGESVELRRIIHALMADERGYFHKAKFMIKKHGLDYRKLYRAGLPYIDVNPQEALIAPGTNTGISLN